MYISVEPKTGLGSQLHTDVVSGLLQTVHKKDATHQRPTETQHKYLYSLIVAKRYPVIRHLLLCCSDC